MGDRTQMLKQQRSRLLSRLVRKPSRVLLLTGGGSRGAAQVGMLDALLREGVGFDAVIGCSVGGLNAARFATEPGLEAIAALEQLWRSLKSRDIFPFSAVSMVRGFSNRPYLFDERPLRNMIYEQLNLTRLEETQLPLAVVTTELLSGSSKVWREGPLVDILTASAALPGIYPPVRLSDGKLHIDGGVASSIPIQAALDLFTPTEIWVLDVLSKPSREEHRTAREVLNTAFSHASSAVATAELSLLSSHSRITLHHLQLPTGLRKIESTSFDHTDELIKVGNMVARDHLAGLM